MGGRTRDGCPGCGEDKPSRYKTRNGGLCYDCDREHYKKYIENRRKVDPKGRWATVIYSTTHARAKGNGTPFSITREDLLNMAVDVCPVLGIDIVYTNTKMQQNSPSIDRYHNELGYVKGNVNIISLKANTMKCNATLEEVKKLAAWMEKIENEQLQK